MKPPLPALIYFEVKERGVNMSLRNEPDNTSKLLMTDALTYSYDKKYDAIVMQHTMSGDILSKEDAIEMVDLLNNYIKNYDVYMKMQMYQREERHSESQRMDLKDKNNRNHKTSFIYLMYDGTYIKIGLSDKPDERLSNLQIGNANIKLLFYAEVHNAYSIERHLHDKYKSKHIIGEWFNLSKVDIEHIKKYLNSLSPSKKDSDM